MRMSMRLWLVLAGVVLTGLVGVAPSLATEPWWELSSISRPGYLPAQSGETGEIAVIAENLGDAAANGKAGSSGGPVVIADTLPAGLEATEIGGSEPGPEGSPNEFSPLKCSLAKLSCTFEGVLEPYTVLELRIGVKVKAGAHSGELNEATATGGGASPDSVSRPITLSDSPTPFGIENFRTRFEEEGGAPDTRAGSHPLQMTTTVTLNQGRDRLPADNTNKEYAKPEVSPVGLAKDVFTKFPVGFIGDPTPFPTCSLAQFLTMGTARDKNPEDNACPAQTAVGVASVIIREPEVLAYSTFIVPLFALETYYGEPARFGFAIPIGNVPIILDASVRSGAGEGALPGESEDDGLNVDTSNITQTTGLISANVTVWGTPGDPSHDSSRGWACLYESRGLPVHEPCEHPQEEHPQAFLTTPTSCAPLQASVEADSWAQPGVFADYLPAEPMPTLRGCNRLPFTPTVQAGPSTNSASSASGLDVNVNFHDEGLTSAEGLAQSDLKDTTVTLPEGFTINPSAGVGLVGCTPADYARETLGSLPGAGCPNEAKLGTVEIQTPVLTTPIHGSLYIAQPFENPFDSLVALYIVAKNPETGILIKIPGKVTPNPITGQLVTTFENTPQLPFDHFNFHFREGAQAPLVTPATCGTFTTQAQLAPWSEPAAVLTDTSSFQITSGVGGGPCPSGGVPPFHPGIQSGMQNNNAGVFSPFYLHLTRTDGEQEISGFSTDLPEGLTGDLSGIPFCPEADIALARQKTGAQEQASPSCPAVSQVGHTLVGTGVGSVLAYVPGELYLAGPYNGAPFSLVAVTSAVVGPFDLGTVVLRFGLRIDPYTAKVSVEPTASEAIPTIIDGIVTHVRDIRVYVDRPNFILNPTSCAPMKIGSTLTGAEGASATVTSPFQAASCASLKFAPKFEASTSGKTSKANGASLSVKLSYPSGAPGTYANIAYAKVELPLQLPSRLTTLQKACLAKQFDANPAGCPPASIIGHARVLTPLIPAPLEGPAYFVSNGGEAFPNLIIVLQGYGVRINLVGDTFISKTGITSTTFKTVPDEPFSSFELNLPEGPYSALGANGVLCAERKTVTVKKRETRRVHGKLTKVSVKVRTTKPTSLAMPSEFLGQNGAAVRQITPVKVTGCPKAKSAAKKRSGKSGSKKK